jgi:hypothetical protein
MWGSANFHTGVDDFMFTQIIHREPADFSTMMAAAAPKSSAVMISCFT